MKKRVSLSLLMAIILAMILVGCGGTTAKPPFSSVALDCSEEDVINEYGACEDIGVNDEGGNVYSYPCTYQEKDGEIYINFTSDGKIKNISWSYNPQSEDEYNALKSAITDEYTEKYGNPALTNEAGSAWNLNKFNVGLFAYALRGNYRVQVTFNPPAENADSSEENSSATTNALDMSEDASAEETAIYYKGDKAQGAGFTLTVNSVDATPEFLDYNDADPEYEYFFISFELENTSNEPLDTNSFFKIYADGEKCDLIMFNDPYDGVDWFDTYTDLEAGRKVKNYISATVPQKWNNIKLVCDDGSTFSFGHSDLGRISADRNSNEEKVYHVGQAMRRNGMKITVKGAVQADYIPNGSSFYYEPAAGNHYVIIIFDIANVSSFTQQFNIATAFDVYVDDYASRFSWLTTEIAGYRDLSDQTYTDIARGKSLAGYKVIEVPDGWQKIEMVSRQGTYEITPDNVEIA